ncbi:MAG: hypothetical protein RSA91_00475 [Bacilli bacterium]
MKDLKKLLKEIPESIIMFLTAIFCFSYMLFSKEEIEKVISFKIDGLVFIMAVILVLLAIITLLELLHKKPFSKGVRLFLIILLLTFLVFVIIMVIYCLLHYIGVSVLKFAIE